MEKVLETMSRNLFSSNGLTFGFGLIAVLFVGVLLWKILRSEEGFVIGYRDWVVGKWQASHDETCDDDAVGAHPGQRSGDPPAIPHTEPQPRGKPRIEPRMETRTEVAPRKEERIRAAGPVAEAAATEAPALESSRRHPEPWELERELQVKTDLLTLSRILDSDLACLMVNSMAERDGKIAWALQTIISGVARVIRPPGRCRCGFFVLDEDEKHLTLAAGEGYAGPRRPRLALENSCAGRAFLSGEHYYCRDINTDPVYWQSQRGSRDYRSIACAPVRAGRSVFGVICCDAEPPDAFVAEDFTYLELFAAKLGLFCAYHALQTTTESRPSVTQV